MKRRAIYPGAFDPVTNGHVDVIERAVRIFDELIVGVAAATPKTVMFSMRERVAMLRAACKGFPTVQVRSFDGLLVDWAEEISAVAIVRGLRALSDFDYEFQMALTNRKLRPSVETVFLMTREEYACISSNMVREVAALGGCVRALVPGFVADALGKKLGAPRRRSRR